MVDLLWLLAWIPLGLVVLVTVVLATPVQFAVALRSEPTRRIQIDARCLGGRAPPIGLIDSVRQERPKPGKRPRKARRTRRRRWVREPHILSATGNLINGVMHRIRVDHLAGHAEFGLADPADTGRLFGMRAPLLYGAPRPQVIALSVRPNFEGQRLAGEVEARFRVTPVALLPPGVVFAWRAFGPRS